MTHGDPGVAQQEEQIRAALIPQELEELERFRGLTTALREVDQHVAAVPEHAELWGPVRDGTTTDLDSFVAGADALRSLSVGVLALGAEGGQERLEAARTSLAALERLGGTHIDPERLEAERQRIAQLDRVAPVAGYLMADATTFLGKGSQDDGGNRRIARSNKFADTVLVPHEKVTMGGITLSPEGVTLNGSTLAWEQGEPERGQWTPAETINRCYYTLKAILDLRMRGVTADSGAVTLYQIHNAICEDEDVRAIFEAIGTSGSAPPEHLATGTRNQRINNRIEAAFGRLNRLLGKPGGPKPFDPVKVYEGYSKGWHVSEELEAALQR